MNYFLAVDVRKSIGDGEHSTGTPGKVGLAN